MLIPKVVSWLVTSGILRTPVQYQQSYLENVFRGNFADTKSGVQCILSWCGASPGTYLSLKVYDVGVEQPNECRAAKSA